MCENGTADERGALSEVRARIAGLKVDVTGQPPLLAAAAQSWRIRRELQGWKCRRLLVPAMQLSCRLEWPWFHLAPAKLLAVNTGVNNIAHYNLSHNPVVLSFDVYCRLVCFLPWI